MAPGDSSFTGFQVSRTPPTAGPATALTGVGGGVLRDLFAGDRPYIFVKHVYACSALLGALVCVYLWLLVGRDIAMLVGFVLVFAMRLCSAHFRWSLPHARRLAEEEEKTS